MDIELNERHRQVLGMDQVRRKRGYKDGWLFYLCRQKGLLGELQELQVAGLIGDTLGSLAPLRPAPQVEVDEDGRVLMPRTLLEVELVPSTCWFSNLRCELTEAEWDRIRRPVFERAGNRCEICGGKGTAHPVECHEVWDYDDQRHVQRLAGLMALCPACHAAKHIGHASGMGTAGQARAHLARVNGWSMDDVEAYLEMQFEQWSRRSQHEWTLDLSWLQGLGVDIDPERG